MEIVKRRIKTLRISNAAQRDYIPEDGLAKVLDEPCIKSLIKQEKEFGIDKVYHEDIIQTLRDGGRKLLAILILIDETKSLRIVLQSTWSDNGPDNCLPLNEAMAQKILSDKDSVKEFLKTQWEFIPPLFRQNSFPKVYDRSTIFPYSWDQRLERPRGNSTIYETRVDTRYLSLNKKLPVTLKYLTVIRKEVPAGNRAEFEARVHRYLNSTKNDSILEMYCSYTFKGYTSMLFEKCDSSLEEFLMSGDEEFSEKPQSYYNAMYGLSSALKELHNFESTELNTEKVGCHYDLKPSNILVKLDDKKFILADFGESTFKDAFEDSRQIAGNAGGDYIAPEWENLDEDFTKLTPSRPSDVWSFGCILLEVVVRMHEGLDGLKAFRKLRKTRQSYHTHYRFHANGQINTAVRDKMNAISSEHTTEPMPTLISLIRAMLVIDPQQRKDIQWITWKLGRIATPTEDESSISQVYPRSDTLQFQERNLASVSSLDSPLEPESTQSSGVTSASGSSAEIQSSTKPQAMTRATLGGVEKSQILEPSTAQSDKRHFYIDMSDSGVDGKTDQMSVAQPDIKNSYFNMPGSGNDPDERDDLQRALTQSLEIFEQGRVKSLWRSQQLRRWIGQSTPRILQISTALDIYMPNVVSRVSAELICNLRTRLGPSSDLFPLYHFCRVEPKKRAEPVLCLVHDILKQLRAISGTTSRARLGSPLERYLKEIRYLLEYKTMAHQTFVCIIDNAQVYISPDDNRDIIRVLTYFQALVNDSGHSAASVKLLFTVVGKDSGSYLSKWCDIPKSDILEFNAGSDADLEGVDKHFFSRYEPVWGPNLLDSTDRVTFELY